MRSELPNEKLTLKLDWTSDDRTDVDGLVGSNFAKLWLEDSQDLCGSLESFEGLKLAELRRGIFSLDRYVSGGMHEARVIYLPGDPYEIEEDPDSVLVPNVTFEVLPDRVHIVCSAISPDGFPSYEETGERLWPLLEREKLYLLSLDVDNDRRAYSVAYLTAEVQGRGRTVGEAMAAGSRLLSLWEATVDGSLNLSDCLDLLNAGQPDLLLGLEENQWLEAKGEPYWMDNPEERFEFAKDVAAMANGGGGLIVVGVGTTKRSGQDTLSKVRPIPSELVDIPRWKKLIQAHVYPPPNGMAIEEINLSDSTCVVVVSVPEQPPGVLPLLVVGSVTGNRFKGNRVSIVERSGSETLIFEPAAIHSLIAIGRAVQRVTGSDPSAPSIPASQ